MTDDVSTPVPAEGRNQMVRCGAPRCEAFVNPNLTDGFCHLHPSPGSKLSKGLRVGQQIGNRLITEVNRGPGGVVLVSTLRDDGWAETNVPISKLRRRGM